VPAVEPAPGLPAGHKVRVLFVEDSQNDVELIVRQLRKGGFLPEWEVVDTAETMEAALARGGWDVIISDHSMPRFDAPAALDVLKASGQDLPFIVVSGNIGEEMAVTCMKAGAHDYVTKGHLARLVPALSRELREADQRHQRRQAVEALRKSEERYRLLVENAADLITVIDMDGRVTFASPSVERVLGYRPEEITGHRVMDFVHGDDAGVVETAIAEAMKEGAPITMNDLRIRHRDGSWRIFEGSGARLAGDHAPAQLVVAARDITDRVQLRQQLQQAQRMEAVGRLAGGVAHDFNNLLTVILGYGNLLRGQVAGNPELRQEVDEIKHAATRAATLTQQLLSFSRKQVMTLRVVDLNDSVRGMSTMLRTLAKEDIELVTRLDPALGRVRIDPGQLEQMLMNLVLNARDAMPDGGRIVIETANVDLDDTFTHRHVVKPGPYVMLSVTDSGCGMEPEIQSRLFEPFFTTKEPGKGTGLGLSMVYGFVKQIGGSIFVYSEPGRGSTFKTYLPRIEGPAEAPVATPPSTRSLRGVETVLLVEDEHLVRTLVADILSKNGYRVLDAADARNALEISRSHRGAIHLMVTDVVMPGMSGIDLARRFDVDRPETRVLYLSGYTDDVVLRNGVLQPGTAFLQKPFTPEVLLQKVRSLLDPTPGPDPESGPALPGPGVQRQGERV
jgi:two-component system cell cycle sensor histidine kinase/response regulator CckA